MNVLLCHNYYQQPGGEDQSFAAESRLLRERGHDVTEYTLHNDAIESMGQLEVAGRTFWNRAVYRELGALVRRVRPDVMHCTNLFPLLSPAAYYAARRQGVPVVQSLRNYRLLCPGALFLRDGRVCEDCLGKPFAWPGVRYGCYRGSRAATAVVAGMVAAHRAMGTWSTAVDLYFTPSAFARQKLVQGGLPGDRIAVKPNFIDPDPNPGSGSRGYAIFVGRLSPEKGLGTLLAAWAGAADLPPLRVVGDGPEADLVRAAAARDPRITLLGRRSLADVLELVGAAACLIMPSLWYETFGRTIIEAFAKGTPVVVSRLGALAELVEDGRTGLLFEPGNATDLADKVRLLLRQDQAALRQAARAAFLAKYTAERNYDMLLDLYEQAVRLAARGRNRSHLPRGSNLETLRAPTTNDSCVVQCGVRS
jgi:glycosyltransferase involved in cell wall biosynthesis